MSPLKDYRFTATYSFPRVSGDEPGVSNVRALAQAFSPRERG